MVLVGVLIMAADSTSVHWGLFIFIPSQCKRKLDALVSDLS